MTALKLIGFTGEIPRIQPRQLPEAGAQYSLNCRLENGALVPVNQNRYIEDLSGRGLSNIHSIYLQDGEWLAWDTVVNAVPGPVATDRLYYTGDGAPKMRVGGTVYDLALTAPAAALTASNGGGGTGNAQTVLYAYTRVTSFGEESEPSPLSNEVNVASGDVVTLTGFAAAPSGRGFTTQRIYRSESGTLYLLAERADGAGSYVDTVDFDAITDELPSASYNQPPADLKCLVGLPNGIMAGISGKQLCFCEPFRPHAWPEKYRLTLDYEGIALGCYGSTVVVGTTGVPYIVQGTHPENMIMEKTETNLPCINARSMVDLGYAVAYASHDGIVLVGPGTARVVTDNLFTRDQWLLTNPSIMVSAQYNGRYFASYEYLDENGDTATGTFLIDLSGSQPAMLRYSTQADATFYDIESGNLYILVGQVIYLFNDVGSSSSEMRWRSKQFVLQRPDNMGAIYIDGGEQLTPKEIAEQEEAYQRAMDENQALYYGSGFTPYEPLLSGFNGHVFGGLQINGNSSETWNNTVGEPGGSMLAELNGAAINVYPLNGDGLARAFNAAKYTFAFVYADNRLVATVTDLNRVVRLPAGFKARVWEVELVGTEPVYEINMASTASELMIV